MLVRNVLEAKVRRLISIGPEATVREALRLFVDHSIGSLPVVDKAGKLIGIFTERDVLYGDCNDAARFHGQLIREVMTPNPITCARPTPSRTSWARCRRTMWGNCLWSTAAMSRD